MKKTIKLRDMTEEQFSLWVQTSCGRTYCCANCPLRTVNCDDCGRNSWVQNKRNFSESFLNQPIDIIVPDLLTKEEKAILSAFIFASSKKVVQVLRCRATHGLIKLWNDDNTYALRNVKDGLFSKLEFGKRYDVSELKLEGEQDGRK